MFNLKTYFVSTMMATLLIASPSYGDTADQNTSVRSTSDLVAIGEMDNNTTIYSDIRGLDSAINLDHIYHNLDIRPKSQNNRPVKKAPPAIISPPRPKLSPTEEKFRIFDEDQNGSISKTEFFLNDLSIYGDKTFKSYDLNKDQKLDTKEFQKYFNQTL